MMLRKKTRTGSAKRARRRTLLTVLLIPVAGCAASGSQDSDVLSIPDYPAPPAVQSQIQPPIAAQGANPLVVKKGRERESESSFVIVPARLGKPDQPLPDWTPELHRSRRLVALGDRLAPANAVSPQVTIDDTAVETASAIAEMLVDEPISPSNRTVTHRMQNESAPKVVELDMLELAAPRSDAQREAEMRLAEAMEAERRAAETRQNAEAELETRNEEARLASLRAERLAQANTDQPDYQKLGNSNGLEAGQPIDLGAALGMAGGNAWTIQLARQKTVEAHSEVDRAEAIWLPTLQLGMGWNKHEGRIQATPGNVIEASRNSFFLGGGATLGNAPVAGGSGGPLRLMADLAIADAFFSPKIARRYYHAERFGISVAKNQAMLQAGTAYVDLLESAGRVSDAQAAIAAADQLVQLTRKFEQAGAGAQADVDRAVTERARLQQDLQNATRSYRVRSAALARRLRLDPTQLLQPVDQYLVPVNLADQGQDQLSQIAAALSQRPEICEQTQRISALCIECRKEAVAPWIPKVTMATSAGMFGGGTGSNFINDGGRGDFDLQALWELENMGLGVAAKRKNVASRLSQQRIALADLRDEIREEVVRASENVENYFEQIRTAESALSFAESSYERNLLRVRNAEGLPIELLQAINARAQGLRARTAAVAAYNRAQLELLHATGQLRG